MREKAIVLLSGGLDSAVALWWARRKGWDIIALGFKYKGKPDGEDVAFLKLCEAADIKHKLALSLPISVSNHNRNAPAGFISMRNLIYYSVAVSIAGEYNAHWIVGGHLRTDGIDFPDAKEKYFEHLNKLINYGNSRRAHNIILPFIRYTKEKVIKMGVKMRVPFKLTWSCFNNGSRHCGKCFSCIDRERAFQEAGIVDPLLGTNRRDATVSLRPNC